MPYKNRQKRLEYGRLYRNKNRERLRIQLKKHDRLRKGKRRKYMREYYLKNTEAINANQRKWAKANPEKVKMSIRKCVARDRLLRPHVHKARTMIMVAIRSGKIKRLPCERCGTLPSEAHHDDYTKPLKVRWLCKKHHTELHTDLKRKNYKV